MARVKRSVVEANALKLLAYLDAHASASSRVAVVPLRSMVTDLHMTYARVRHLVRLLDERGYIEVEHRFADDGGGRPNAHRITRVGSIVLDAYRAGLRYDNEVERLSGALELVSSRSDEQFAQ